MSDKFWSKFCKANEMGKHDLVETLVGYKKMISVSLPVSYFIDLEDFVRKDERKLTIETIDKICPFCPRAKKLKEKI